MKQIKYVISLVLLAFVSNIIAQEPVVTWGKVLPNNNPDVKITELLGYDNSGFYVARKSGPITDITYIVEKYNSDLNLEFSKSIQTHSGQMGDMLLFKEVLLTNDGLLAFYQGWKKAEGKGSCVVKKYNSSGEESGENIELEKVSAEKQMNAGSYHPTLSPDRTKLLIVTDMPFVKDSKEKLKLRVFDTKTLTELWNKEITLENESSRGVNNEGFVDNNGNAYVFKKVNIEKVLNYQLFTCNANGIWSKNLINMNSKVMCQYNISFNSMNDLVISGFYDTKTYSNVEGTFYFRVDNKSLKLTTQNLQPLGAKLIENWKTANNAAKEGANLSNFDIKNVLNLSTGNSLIVAEYSTETSTNIAAAGATPVYQYNISKNDIMVICLNTDGSQAWNAVVKKNQEEKTIDTDNAWSSFVYTLVDDKLHVIWNNSALNIITIPPIKWQSPAGTTYTQRRDFDENTTAFPSFMHIIETNGTVTYANSTYGLPLFNLHKGSPFRMSVNPNVFFPIKDGIIIIGEMSDRKRYRFGKITL